MRIVDVLVASVILAAAVALIVPGQIRSVSQASSQVATAQAAPVASASLTWLRHPAMRRSSSIQ